MNSKPLYPNEKRLLRFTDKEFNLKMQQQFYWNQFLIHFSVKYIFKVKEKATNIQ